MYFLKPKSTKKQVGGKEYEGSFFKRYKQFSDWYFYENKGEAYLLSCHSEHRGAEKVPLGMDAKNLSSNQALTLGAITER